ncbi:hypothetical protein BURK_004692 [Burkholderia sp. SJ98]|nr:hypothetical protein BURK_004692 [Burkholderia sp. SJ98]
MKAHHLAVFVSTSLIATYAVADSLHNYPPQEGAGTSAVAYVQSTPASQAPVASAAPGGKTRKQVMDELKQAERDGLVPMSRWDYPPSQRLIEMNKERYAARHGDPQGD